MKSTAWWCGVKVGAIWVWALSPMTAAPALGATCKLDMPPPRVTVKTFNSVVRVNNGHSSKQLAAKMGSHGKFSRSAGWITRGLTKTTLEGQISVDVRIRPIAKNRYCIGLQKVDAQVGHKEFKIYVARDLRPGTCEYRTTMSHENAHVSIYKDQLRQFVQRFQNRLMRSASSMRPIVSNSKKAGPDYFLKKLNMEFRLLYKQMSRETDMRQGRLDSEQNYRREQALCPPRPR